MATAKGQTRDENLQRKCVVVDDLIRNLAEEDGQAPLIAYPRGERSVSDFEKFTAIQIDEFVSNAVESLISEGLSGPIDRSASSVVGLLGRSDFEYVITMFALSRLGYTVLLLSPRLPVQVYVSLITNTGCDTLISSKYLRGTVDEIARGYQLKTLMLLSMSSFVVSALPRRCMEHRKPSSNGDIAFILHSSGSTGLPKCSYLTHATCLHNFSLGYRLHGLLTLPLYHMHGHSCLYRTMNKRKTCFMYNASLPFTAKHLNTALDEAQPELLLTVPYGLKLLSESSTGIDALRKCKMVSYAGSACPDELGDYLSACGVKLASTYGL